jgi:hypothetical protein
MSAPDHRDPSLTAGQRFLLERLGGDGQIYTCPLGSVLWNPWTPAVRLTEDTMAALQRGGELTLVAEYGGERRLYVRRQA